MKPLPAPAIRKLSDVSSPIICRHVFDSIGIHANGDIVCWDVDIHGKRVYGNVFHDRIADVFNGPGYREIREWFLTSRPDSWCPAVGYHCALRSAAPIAAQKVDECSVKVIRLEPITYCNLQCPVCPVETSFKHDPVVRSTRGNKLLPLKIMLDVVDQLPDLEVIEYFGFGEPFLHKDTVPFLRAVKRKRPNIEIVTNTNGTVMTPTQIASIAAESLMDRVVFSIDGSTNESYSKYRIGGTFATAFGKMKALTEACRAADSWKRYVQDQRRGVQITWQYILFEWNDGDEELSKAREAAASIGVPIEWVITTGYGASKRFLPRSEEARRLMDPPNSFIHMASNADIATRLQERGIAGIHATGASAHEVTIDCELIALPYFEPSGYSARITARDSCVAVRPGSTVTINVEIKNSTGQGWDNNRLDYLRVGGWLIDIGIESHELGGAVIPSSVALPNGQGTLQLTATLPSEPKEYELLIDVVQEWVAWFGDRGSKGLRLPIHVRA